MIVFSDMDGTLLTSDKQMSDATWAMLDELARRGIEFAPCTGRPLSGVFEAILAHPAVHYAVCANGASVWQLDEDVPTDASRATRILSRPLDRAIAHRVHSIAAGHDVTFDIFADGQCFLPRSLYTRLDEFCGGDPHIAASLKRTRTPIDMGIDSKIDEVEVLERIAMYMQNVDRIHDLVWVNDIKYSDVHLQAEIEQSKYYLDEASIDLQYKLFDMYEAEAKRLLDLGLAFPGYDHVLKCSHAFNILQARGAISVTDRQSYINRVRTLSRMAADCYLKQREEMGYPLLKNDTTSKED